MKLIDFIRYIFSCNHNWKWHTTDIQGRRKSANYYDILRATKPQINSPYQQCTKCKILQTAELNKKAAIKHCGYRRV